MILLKLLFKKCGANFLISLFCPLEILKMAASGWCCGNLISSVLHTPCSAFVCSILESYSVEMKRPFPSNNVQNISWLYCDLKMLCSSWLILLVMCVKGKWTRPLLSGRRGVERGSRLRRLLWGVCIDFSKVIRVSSNNLEKLRRWWWRLCIRPSHYQPKSDNIFQTKEEIKIAETVS